MIILSQNKVMNKVYLSLGSNKGDRYNILKNALCMISERTGCIILKSGIYETEPWGYESENYFFNQCILVETGLNPMNVLYEISDIERSNGRKRYGKKFTDRVLDIDMLYFNHDCIIIKNLIIPHPLLHKRKFVLIPLCEIAPDFVHPLLKKRTDQLLKECDDELIVRKTQLCD